MNQNSVQFTESDCTAVLKQYFNNVPVKLLNYSLEPISNEINGLMGEHLRLKINVINGTKQECLRLFVKTLIAEHEIMAEFAKTGNMFNKEIFWYQFLGEVKKECPDFDISFAPKYYFSKDNEFIVLEDLYDSDCKMYKGLYLDKEHLKVAIKSIAKYHAASLVLEEIKSKKLGRKYRLMEDYGEWLKESMYRQDENYLGYKYIQCGLRSLQALIDLLPEDGISAEEFKEKLSSLVTQAFEDSKPSEEFRNVWCNGDLWVKNVMFRYKKDIPVACKIFDFQLQRYNPPAHDVFLMIYESTCRKDRQRHLEDYFNFYYEALTSELKLCGYDIAKLLNRDEFDITCSSVIPVLKLTKTIYTSISAMSPESFKNVTSNPDLYAKLTFDDRAEFVVELFKSEKHYREVMTVLMEDLRDVLTHEKITIEDCYKILRQKLGTTEYDLLEYQVTPFAEKYGFLGEHANLKIKVREKDEIKELNFFVKSIPKEIGQKNFVVSCKIFFKEMKYYSKIIPEMIANNVTCVEGCTSNYYLARLNEVIVFDDYSLKGYITLNPRTPYNYETVVVIIKKIAQLHASALILEEKLSIPGKKYRLGDSYPEEFVEAFYKDTKESMDALGATIKGCLTQIDLFPDPNSKITQEVFKKRATKALNRMLEHIKPSLKYRNTICHGDLWPNNILLKFENNSPIDCLFVDFQTTRYNPPAHDLVSFLYLSTDQKFRTKYMSKILDLYYVEISRIFLNYKIDVNDVLPYEEFLRSCDDMKEFAAAQCINHFQNTKLTSTQIQELFVDQEFARKILFEDRSPYIKKICSIDPVYEEQMRECIGDLREICENSNVLD